MGVAEGCDQIGTACGIFNGATGSRSIAAFASKISKIAKASRALSKGTYLGMALDVGSTALEIQEACAAGRVEKCTEAKYVEGGKLVGGLSLSTIGGAVGGFAGTSICLAIGVPTGGIGTVGCAVVGGAILGWAGRKFGSWGGEFLGELLYSGHEIE